MSELMLKSVYDLLDKNYCALPEKIDSKTLQKTE